MNLLGIVLYSFTGLLFLGLAFFIWLLIDTISFSSIHNKRYPYSRKKPSEDIRITNNNYIPSNKKQNYRSRDENLCYLERELLTLVRGDKALANRLLLNIRFKNPQKNKSWCYEKVIYDLKRDRGGI
jgi:hypothetical protein